MVSRYFLKVEDPEEPRDRERDGKRRAGVSGKGEPDRIAFRPPFVLGDRLKDIGSHVLSVRNDQNVFLGSEGIVRAGT